MALTASNMLQSLRNRLNDPDNSITDAVKYRALNDSQLEIVQTLPEEKLIKLTREVKGQSTGDGIDADDSRYLKLTKSDITLFAPDGSLRFVSGSYRESATGYTYWFNPLFIRAKWKIENSLIYSDYTNPAIFDYGGYYYIYPTLPTGYVFDVNHIKIPLDISDSQDCELDDRIHFLVINCAEFLLKNTPEQIEITLQKYLKDLGISAIK